MSEEPIAGAVESNVAESNPNAVKSRILDVIAQEIAAGPNNVKSIYNKTHFGKSLEKNRA
jgi:hypothetical protein